MKKRVISLLLVFCCLIMLLPTHAAAATSQRHSTNGTYTLDVYTGNSNITKIYTKFEVTNNAALLVDVYYWNAQGQYVTYTTGAIIRNNSEITLPSVKTRYQYKVRQYGSQQGEWRIKSSSTSVTRIDG